MEKETIKLLNVLRRIARSAGYAAWSKAPPDAARFCAAQYNKVLVRLSELEPAVGTLFMPLSEDALPEITRIAASELAAYFEEQTGRWAYREWHCGHRKFRFRCRPASVWCD